MTIPEPPDSDESVGVMLDSSLPQAAVKQSIEKIQIDFKALFNLLFIAETTYR